MWKLWLVAWYEFKRYALKKGFILGLLSVPLIIVLIFGLILIIGATERDDTPVGYVDQAGFLKDPISAPKRAGSPNDPEVAELVPLMSFPSEEAARQALESRKIQVYYLIAPDYLESNKVELVYFKPPGRNVRRQFWDFMQINKIREVPINAARRAVADTSLIVRWPDDVPGGGREFSQRTFLSNLLPIFTGVAFIVLLFISSGYLMGAVIEEKESRTMEIMVTSVSSFQLIGGKVLGAVALSFTHLIVWATFALLGVFIGGYYFGIEALQNLTLDLRITITMLAIAIPTYVMVAAMMTSVGVMVTEVQEAQQMSFIFVLPFWITMWLVKPILQDPNGPLAMGLSFFPLTALPAFIFRVTFIPVSLWQIGASVAILILCAVGGLWLAGRAFRLGMLQYGKRLNLAELFRREQHE